MKYLPEFLLLPLIVLLSACGSLSRTDKATDYYQLDANLLINGRPLNQQSIELSGKETRILYFHDDVRGHTYKVKYGIAPGELEHTLIINTQIYQTVKSPSFLVHDDKEASFIFKEEAPEVEVKVRAKQIH